MFRTNSNFHQADTECKIDIAQKNPAEQTRRCTYCSRMIQRRIHHVRIVTKAIYQLEQTLRIHKEIGPVNDCRLLVLSLQLCPIFNLVGDIGRSQGMIFVLSLFAAPPFVFSGVSPLLLVFTFLSTS